MTALPERFLLQMKKQLDEEEYQAFLQSYDAPSLAGLRINTSKISPEEWRQRAPFATTPVPWIHNGFSYDPQKSKPSKDVYYHCGLFYLQEPSAMTPASRLPVQPGDRVLDLCAAPGGKATELGARLLGRGCLVANDISASRANGLLKNLELNGIPNGVVTVEEPKKLASRFPLYFDKILVDAPCSGEGMFRRDPSMVNSWEEKDDSYYVPIQRTILTHAVSMLRPGGKLLYSTCTFSQKEDEENILWLLQEYPQLHLIEMEGYQGFSKGLLPGTEQCVRIWPHCMEGEGHFLALLEKRADDEHLDIDFCLENKDFKHSASRPSKSLFKSKDFREFWKFLKDCSYPVPETDLRLIKDGIYLLPEGFQQPAGIRVLRSGLLLGTMKKERFTPSQAFAMALNIHQYRNTISFTREDPRIQRYLKGETIFLDDGITASGWQLVCVDGYPLGWAKGNKDSLKNKYAPGWRIC